MILKTPEKWKKRKGEDYYSTKEYQKMRKIAKKLQENTKKDYDGELFEK